MMVRSNQLFRTKCWKRVRPINRSGDEHGNRLGFCSYRRGIRGAAYHVGTGRFGPASNAGYFRNASGQAAASPSPAMNSRRLLQSSSFKIGAVTNH